MLSDAGDFAGGAFSSTGARGAGRSWFTTSVASSSPPAVTGGISEAECQARCGKEFHLSVFSSRIIVILRFSLAKTPLAPDMQRLVLRDNARRMLGLD